MSQEHKKPPTRKIFFLNKAISHLSYSSLTEWFVFPGLRAPRSLEDICHQGEDAGNGGQTLWSMLHTSSFVTLSNLQQFSEYSKCLNGKAKPLPHLLTNVHRIVSCNKPSNPGNKISVYIDGFIYLFFSIFSVV